LIINMIASPSATADGTDCFQARRPERVSSFLIFRLS
jgi:hypothetical protein